ncbi:hypothetical protein WJX72_000388 [[Myrmecia] bisecta]|uniref:DEP domain-containing protein n=1 Tax=[Myrmecia] bisecta TaxID=41462 RepID=A0AAW1PNQ5_9CHLO
MSTEQEGDIERVAEELRRGLDIKDRKHHLKTYPKFFTGSDAVKYLISSGRAKTEQDALDLGNGLMAQGVFHHVTRDHAFKDEPLFYRFTADEEAFSGGPTIKDDGKAVSWADRLLGGRDEAGPNLQAQLPSWDDAGFQSVEKDLGVSPLDKCNLQLLDNVHPAQWQDATPQPMYNMVVIGAGAGGLVSAAGSAGVGARVAIVEEHLLGGDCLNVGCVPSKALIRCARAAYQARNAEQFGVHVDGVRVDFGKVMERMRCIRAEISKNDSAKRFAQQLGVDVYLGHAKFTSKHTLEVNGKTLRFATAVIAAGGSPKVPPIPGLLDVPFLTNVSFFNLTELPKRLGVIGTGPIGLELAQAMARLGAQVTVFGRTGRILEKEDPDAAGILQQQLEREGIKLMTQVELKSVSKRAGGDVATHIEVHICGDKTQDVVVVDQLLVATGRSPNVKRLGLEAAGVEFTTADGVKVNDYLQTSQKHIFAVGDVCTPYKFTHVADFMARLVVRNALFFGRGKFSALIIPWATYTEPEIAHVGLYPRDLEQRGIKFDTYTKKLEDNDRAICDSQTEGFVKVHTKGGTDTIVGATIVAADAGNMISELTAAMQGGIGLGALASVIHPYPTQAEAIRQSGDLYNKTRLTPFVKTLFRGVMAAQRATASI